MSEPGNYESDIDIQRYSEELKSNASDTSPQPSKQHAIAAAVGTICTWVAFSSILRQMEPGLQTSERVTSGGITLASLIGVACSIAAWRKGGFAKLKQSDLPPLLKEAKERVAGIIHGIGLALQGLGVLLACLTLLSVLSDQPNKGLAIASVGCYLIGKFLRSILRGLPATVADRLRNLERDLKGVSEQAEQARTGLARIATEIADVDKDVRKTNTRLKHLAMTNEELNKRLNADPSEVRHYTSAFRREHARNMRQQWLGVLIGVLAGFILGYVVDLTSNDVMRWFHDIGGWLF